MSNYKQVKILDHCIACTTCSNVASPIFGLTNDGHMAYVITQPTSSQLEKKTLEAMRSCPVSAIKVKKQ